MNTARAFINDIMPKPALLFRLGKGKKSKVSCALKPVSKVTVEDSLHFPADIMPSGGVFCVEYMDGTTREVMIPIDGTTFIWEEAKFLKEGRRSNAYMEAHALRVEDIKDTPSDCLIQKMKHALAQHSTAAKAAAVARLAKKHTP